MALGGAPDHDLWAVPPQVRAEWLELQRAVDVVGPVACQISDPKAWWPDRYEMKTPATRDAITACRTCPAADPCLAYALAADERYGGVGGLLPEERRAMRWRASDPTGTSPPP